MSNSEWLLDTLPLPFNLDVDADMKNAQTNAFFVYPPLLPLPDKTTAPEHPNGAQLMGVFLIWRFTYWSLLAKKKSGRSNHRTSSTDNDCSSCKSAEENADYSKMYNPQSLRHNLFNTQ